MDSDTSPNPFASSPASSPSPLPSLPPPVPRKPSSLISAASGSPPPTHRASFPDPSRHPKMGATVPGPRPKTDFCCSIDKDISAGEQVHIVDALKTTEGGTASYITYVIRLGVSQCFCPVQTLLTLLRLIQSDAGTRLSSHSIKRSLAFTLY